MGIDLPTIVASPRVSTAVLEAASFDERWAAWQAKNAAHDHVVRRKMAIAGPILIIVVAVVILLLGR